MDSDSSIPEVIDVDDDTMSSFGDEIQILDNDEAPPTMSNKKKRQGKNNPKLYNPVKALITATNKTKISKPTTPKRRNRHSLTGRPVYSPTDDVLGINQQRHQKNESDLEDGELSQSEADETETTAEPSIVILDDEEDYHQPQLKFIPCTPEYLNKHKQRQEQHRQVDDSDLSIIEIIQKTPVTKKSPKVLATRKSLRRQSRGTHSRSSSISRNTLRCSTPTANDFNYSFEFSKKLTKKALGLKRLRKKRQSKRKNNNKTRQNQTRKARMSQNNRQILRQSSLPNVEAQMIRPSRPQQQQFNLQNNLLKLSQNEFAFAGSVGRPPRLPNYTKDRVKPNRIQQNLIKLSQTELPRPLGIAAPVQAATSSSQLPLTTRSNLPSLARPLMSFQLSTGTGPRMNGNIQQNLVNLSETTVVSAMQDQLTRMAVNPNNNIASANPTVRFLNPNLGFPDSYGVPRNEDALLAQFNTTDSTSSMPSSNNESEGGGEQQPRLALSNFGGNMFAPVGSNLQRPGTLRPIIIDGSNVAMAHGNNVVFSCLGIRRCVDFFKQRGHKTIIAWIPHFRERRSQITNPELLEVMEREGVLKYTPGRQVEKLRISAYDDNFIVQTAAQLGGVVVSNDHFRDLYEQEPSWRDTILKRILQFVWATPDTLIFPPDPLGRNNLSLDEFLTF